MLAHCLVLTIVPIQRCMERLQVLLTEFEHFVQLHSPAGQAHFSKMPDNQTWFSEHFATRRTIRRSITHQRRMATGHRINMATCAGMGFRDHTGKALGALITGEEAHILLHVFAQLHAVAVKVADPWDGVDGKNVYRKLFQLAVRKQGIGQHMATDATPAPPH
ncbi:hypothetical protein D3C79_850080 [compost metagenome]